MFKYFKEILILAKPFIKPNLSRHSIFTRNYRTATNQEIKRLTDGIKFLYKDEKVRWNSYDWLRTQPSPFLSKQSKEDIKKTLNLVKSAYKVDCSIDIIDSSEVFKNSQKARLIAISNPEEWVVKRLEQDSFKLDEAFEEILRYLTGKPNLNLIDVLANLPDRDEQNSNNCNTDVIHL